MTKSIDFAQLVKEGEFLSSFTLNNIPQLKNNDDFGHLWFCYWKISHGLWKSKLREIQISEKNKALRIIVPIYWSFHHGIDQIDFGQENPQTDLCRLSNIATELNIDVIYLFPFTPIPLWPNGGIPPRYAKIQSQNKEGLQLRVKNPLGEIHKIYSYYDPEIFQGLKKFAWYTRHYFDQMQISHSIYGLNAGYMDGEEFISYRKDYSSAYDKALEKFLAGPIDSKIQDQNSHFEKSIQNLFDNTISHTLSEYYRGTIDIAFLNGHPCEILKDPNQDLLKQEGDLELISILFKKAKIPNFYLLATIESDPAYPGWRKICNELEQLPYTSISNVNEATPYGLLTSICIVGMSDFWNQLGIQEFFHRGFHNTVVSIDQCDDIVFQEDSQDKCSFFYEGSNLNEIEFKKILGGFLLGYSFVINMSGIDRALENRLNIFIVENGLNETKINLIMPINLIELGEGKIILFYPENNQSNSAFKQSLGKKLHFWEKVFQLLDIAIPPLQIDKGLFYFWKTNNDELTNITYSSSRKLFIYNYDERIRFIRVYKKDEFKICNYTPIPFEFSKISHFSTFEEISISPKGMLEIEFGII